MASDVTKMTRLVKIVSLLRKNVYPNHKTVEKALRSLDVAGVYNVSQKTIQRDVQYLRDMHAAPIAFDNGRRAMKTGVVLFELTPADKNNLDLFEQPDEKNLILAETMDKLNYKYGRNTIFTTG